MTWKEWFIELCMFIGVFTLMLMAKNGVEIIFELDLSKSTNFIVGVIIGIWTNSIVMNRRIIKLLKKVDKLKRRLIKEW